MPQNVIPEIASACAYTLSEILLDSLAFAHTETERRLTGHNHQKYPNIRPLLLRIEFREILESISLPPEWRLEGNTRQPTQLLLSNDQAQLRFLKETRVQPDGVPIAGSNMARRRWYQQSLPLFNDPPVPLNLLLLWDYDNPMERKALSLRIVHSTGAGQYKKQMPIDLSLALQPGATLDQLQRFETSDEDLFFISDEEVDHA